MLTARRLRETLHYNPETGVFIWIQPASNRVQAGMEAGRIHEVCGYRQIGVDGRRYQAHRLAWLYMTEEWPSDMIDHINCDRADNRFSNLRESCNSDNVKNRRKQARKTKQACLALLQLIAGLGQEFSRMVRIFISAFSIPQKRRISPTRARQTNTEAIYWECHYERKSTIQPAPRR